MQYMYNALQLFILYNVSTVYNSYKRFCDGLKRLRKQIHNYIACYFT